MNNETAENTEDKKLDWLWWDNIYAWKPSDTSCNISRSLPKGLVMCAYFAVWNFVQKWLTEVIVSTYFMQEYFYMC